MPTPRDIRRLAFSALFQLDARGDEAGAEVRAALDDSGDESLRPQDRDRAFELARAAFDRRLEADKEVAALSPAWPPNRQPAADRAIIRLAHYEMTSGRTAPKVAVSEAVELAKEFSTERSPAFVNGVLDKVLKRMLRAQTAPPAAPAPADDAHETA